MFTRYYENGGYGRLNNVKGTITSLKEGNLKRDISTIFDTFNSVIKYKLQTM